MSENDLRVYELSLDKLAQEAFNKRGFDSHIDEYLFKEGFVEGYELAKQILER